MADLVIASLTGGQVERYAEADRLTCSAVSAILGGQIVELVTGGAERRVQPAGAGSNLVVGVAMYDAATNGILTVATEGVWLLTATAAAITAGQRVIAGAAGLVVAAGATPDARQLIGFAIGDIASGGVGPIKLGGSL